MNNISIRTREEANILNRGNTHNYLDGTFFNQFTGYKYVRHEGKQIPEHKLVYMFYNDLAEIPKGYDIHHIDGDKLNNDILNLELMPERDHIHLHQKTNMEVCEDGR